jgi:hypothetical protein
VRVRHASGRQHDSAHHLGAHRVTGLVVDATETGIGSSAGSVLSWMGGYGRDIAGVRVH